MFFCFLPLSIAFEASLTHIRDPSNYRLTWNEMNFPEALPSKGDLSLNEDVLQRCAAVSKPTYDIIDLEMIPNNISEVVQGYPNSRWYSPIMAKISIFNRPEIDPSFWKSYVLYLIWDLTRKIFAMYERNERNERKIPLRILLYGYSHGKLRGMRSTDFRRIVWLTTTAHKTTYLRVSLEQRRSSSKLQR